MEAQTHISDHCATIQPSQYSVYSTSKVKYWSYGKILIKGASLKCYPESNRFVFLVRQNTRKIESIICKWQPNIKGSSKAGESSLSRNVAVGRCFQGLSTPGDHIYFDSAYSEPGT